MLAAKKIIAPALLDPKNHALILLDQQYLQLLGVRSHDATLVANGVILLAKGAKVFGVKTLLTTSFVVRQALLRELQEVFPEQEPIDRTTLNAFEDERVVLWTEAAGRGKLVLAGLWTESCLAMSALSALSAGYEVYVVTNASGGTSKESHEMALQRMIAAGATPLTAGTYLSELQRDWSRSATAEPVLAICAQHGNGYGERLIGSSLEQSSPNASATASPDQPRCSR
jgi:nicotinamidase-related amidase